MFDKFFLCRRALTGDNPMHGGEQFQSKRRFEAFHEATDPLEAFAHLWLLIQNSSGIVDGAGYQFQHFVRLVAAVSEARDIVAFDCTENVVKIFGLSSTLDWPSFYKV